MNLIFYNGKIMTMENETSIYSAIAINQNKIHALGDDETILSLQTEVTQIINLEGKILLPGFNDSHMHLLGYGAALSQVDLSTAKSIEDIIQITREFIQNNHIPKNTWVMGRGWNQDHFPSNRMPDFKDLDKISREHYICLRRTCGHVATVNQYALNHLELSTAYTKVDGGEYYDGIFKENAYDLIMNKIPDPTLEEIQKWILLGCETLHTYGITSVQSDDLCVFSDSLSELIFEAFESLARENKLPLHVYEQSLFRNESNFKKFINKGYVLNKSIGTFKYGPLKILGDGSLGGRTAWLKDGYQDADSHGIHMYEQEELDRFIMLAQKNNISTATHCIGDAMLDSALRSIEKAQDVYPNDMLRHGIVHCQITRLDQLERMKRLNVMAYIQPIFLDYDLHIVEDRVGAELTKTSYNWKTMDTLNIVMAFGSDAPVETPDPIKGIHCAVLRQDLRYYPSEGFLSNQKISLYKALESYTRSCAYASFDETNKGLLKVGYDADLVVLEGDIYQNILHTKIDTTVFQGKIVYKKK